MNRNHGTSAWSDRAPNWSLGQRGQVPASPFGKILTPASAERLAVGATNPARIIT